MTITSVLSIMLLGVISGNVIVASGVGIDLASSRLNSIKNSLILSLVIFFVTLLSAVIIYICGLIIGSAEQFKYMVIIGFIAVSTMVQIAEFVLKKIFPIVYVKLGTFFVTLIPTISVILFAIFANGYSFLELMTHIVFSCVGIMAVLMLIAGIRNNKLTYSTQSIFKGCVMTMAILFVLSLIVSAV